MGVADIENRPHALYRLFAHDDALLYVGITCDVGSRWKRHSDDKPWWSELSRTTVQHYPNRSTALEAERTAIQNEHPKYNVQHNQGKPFSRATGSASTRGVVREGDCIALGLDNGECPVGLVTDVDETGIRLAQLSWLSGRFDLPRVVLREQIVEVLHAGMRRESEFDCEPLGVFQGNWTDVHMPRFVCIKCGQEERWSKRRAGGVCWSCDQRKDESCPPPDTPTPCLPYPARAIIS
jgi:predicted GIY-YIG superfamily endonuclease